MNIVLILITRSLGEGHDAECILKENWWIRCGKRIVSWTEQLFEALIVSRSEIWAPRGSGLGEQKDCLLLRLNRAQACSSMH